MLQSELSNQLFQEIARKDLQSVERILRMSKRNDVDISKIYDSRGLTPLMAAVESGDIKILKAILVQQSRASVAQFVDIYDETGAERKSSATYLAIAYNRIEVVDFFIQNRLINIASNDLPKIAVNAAVLNESMKHLVKTRELYSLLQDGNPKLESVKILVKDGAVINSQLLEVYARKLVSAKSSEKLSDEEIFDIKSNIRYLIERGVKVNNAQPATFLKNAVDAIISTDAAGTEIIDARSTHLAIALLQNSAGFNLDEEQKIKLTKGVFQHDPEYAKVLISKGWIKPNLEIEGLELDDYAAKIGLDQEIVKAIADQPLQEDLIHKKKQKALRESLVLEGWESAPGDIAKVLKGELVAGVNTSGEVKFAAVQEDGRTKKFLEKESDSVAQQYGNEMLRALSKQQYGIKRGVLIKGKDGKPYFATKWDDSVAGGYFLENGVPAKDQDKEFVKNYARLCGVVHVLGEYDWNQRNYLKSAKTGRPVKIDNTPLVNGLIESQQRIYGSFQSNAFLHFLAGEVSSDSGYSSSPIDKINSALAQIKGKKIDQKKSDEIVAKAFIDGYKEGVGKELFSKIKQNIEANPDLKEAFIEFMTGIKDSIDLADDKEFLDQYAQKYQKELGGQAFAAAKKCQEFLQENAKEAQKQFKDYLEYFAKIAPERSAKVARKIAATAEVEVMESMEEMLASDEINSKKGVDKFIRKFGDVIQNEIQASKLLAKISMAADKEVVAHLYDKIIALQPSFRNIALFVPVTLFPAKISEEKYIEIIKVLRDKGCAPSDSYAVKGGEELAKSIFAHCKDERAATLLRDQFKLPNQNVGKDEQELFRMIDSGNVEEVKKQIKIFRDKGINFNGVFNESGLRPIDYALMGDNLDAIKALIKELPEASVVKEMHMMNCEYPSPLQAVTALDSSIEVMNYFLEQGYYNLDDVAQYSSIDKVLSDTARLKELVSYKLGDLSADLIEEVCKEVNLKALVRDFEVDSATRSVVAVSKGKSFLQIYVENLSSEKESVKANAGNSSKVIKLFVEKGLDVNAAIEKNGKSASLLQYTIDSINLGAKKINFENAFIAIALIENGARFDNLTNQQKSKLVRGIMKHQPEYLKNLLDKGVIRADFLVEKAENGIVKKIPLKTYVLDPKIKAPKAISDLFDVAKAIDVKSITSSGGSFSSVVEKRNALISKAAHSKEVTIPKAVTPKAVIPKAVSPKGVGAIPKVVATPQKANVPALSRQAIPERDPSVSVAGAQAVLNEAFALAAKSRKTRGDNAEKVLTKFISACQKITKFQEEQKALGRNISNNDIIAELWPDPNARSQTPKLARLDLDEQNALSTVALSYKGAKIVNDDEFQKPKSKTQVFLNLEKLGSAAIAEWISKAPSLINATKSSVSKVPSSIIGMTKAKQLIGNHQAIAVNV